MKRSSWNHLAEDLCLGSTSGFLATFPMTATMNFLHKYLVFYDQHNPPPKKFALRVARRIGICAPLYKRKKRKILSFVSHYSYGAGTGAIYPILSKKIPMHPAVTGSLYCLLVWAAGYLGWLPATGLWNPTRESKGRRISMLTAHIVWGGASLGLIYSALKTKLTKTRGSDYVASQAA
jgi:uncharacterized membrane protein YagU involved in acid resistance